MIDELYINGTQLDINDIDIPRRYVSPYFRNVTEWVNNSTYTVTLPFTANNVAFFEHCMTADAASLMPYSLMLATYYCDGDLVFKDAETKMLGIVDDGFEVQFVWGVNRNKYLPFFDTKLNEIRPNGSTILESDWVVDWRKDNVKYATGKKFKYIDYISGVRESDIVLLDGTTLKATVEAPAPFNDNLKEMTMHPFIPFNNILDLACAAVSQDIAGIVETIIDQAALQLLSGAEFVTQGDVLKSIDDSGDISNLNIRVVAVVNEIVYFNADITDFYDGETPIVFVRSAVPTSELSDLKSRLTDKGLILGGNKGNRRYSVTKNFPSAIYINDVVRLDDYVGSFTTDSDGNYISINPNVIGNDKNPITISLNMFTTPFTNISLYKNDVIFERFEYSGGKYQDLTFVPEYGSFYSIVFESASLLSGGASVVLSQTITNPMYSMIPELDETDQIGYYDCLLNLPDMTVAEFIQQMLIMTGLFISFDNNGDMRFVSLDTFKDNLDSGVVQDWSNRVHEVMGTQFNFMDLAQNNLIKYANSDATNYDSTGNIIVNNFALEREKELYNLVFDLPLTGRDRAEIIMYKQKVSSSGYEAGAQVSFSNEYQNTNNVAVLDDSGVATYRTMTPNDVRFRNLRFNGFITEYYFVFKSMVNRAFIQDIEVNLNIYEQGRFDFTKPVYIDWLGRYCMVLEILGMRDEVCVAKVLIVKNL